MDGSLTKISRVEGIATEYKEIWQDEYLKTICAFANTGDAELYVGVNDKREVVGLENCEEWLSKISRKIRSKLSYQAKIRIHDTIDDKEYLVIQIDKAPSLIVLDGAAYKRINNETVKMTSEELSDRIIENSGRGWDEYKSTWKIDKVSRTQLDKFAVLAKDTFPSWKTDSNLTSCLESLGLLDGEYLKNAAVLLFADNPHKMYAGITIQFGVFRGGTRRDEAFISGNLLDSIEELLNKLEIHLTSRVVQTPVDSSLKSMQHLIKWDYPVEALREAVVNAVAHRDYNQRGNVVVEVHEDRTTIWNPGVLLHGTSISSLKRDVVASKQVVSRRRNPLLSDLLHKARVMESWGTGIKKMRESCLTAGLPAPELEEVSGGFRISFVKDIFHPDRLMQLNLNHRQLAMLELLKTRGVFELADMLALTGKTLGTDRMDVLNLVEKGIVEFYESGGAQKIIVRKDNWSY